MNIDRSKFDTLSTEQQIMRSVRIQSTDEPNWPTEAVCSICEEEYNGHSHCEGELCWRARKSFAFCDSDYYHYDEVPEAEIARLCKGFRLTFIGFIIGKDFSSIYETHADAVDAMRTWEMETAHTDYNYLSKWG